LGFQRVSVDICENDERAIRLAEKWNMSRIGEVDICKVDGKLQKEIRYFLTRDMFKE
jgi:RimJ/RimL family protein N-acetyltransferase